jgi:endonuclease/exonuclease/phosphatase family metal-dependent hydrolase
MTETLRVATWNIKHGGTAEHGPKGYIGDPEEMAACCVQLDADILALQEVDRLVWRSGFKDLVRMVAEATGMEAYFGKNVGFNLGAGINPGGQYGNALFVRGEIQNAENLPLYGDHKRLTFRGQRYNTLRERRGAILARAVVRGQQVEVAATHTGGPESKQQQIQSAAARLLSRPGDSYLFMADLNAKRRNASKWLTGEPFNMTLAPEQLIDGKPDPTVHVDNIAVKGLDILDAWAVHLPISDHNALVAEVTPRRAA